MRLASYSLLPFVCLCLCLFASCEEKPPASTPSYKVSSKPSVYVDNHTLAYFAERVGGPEIEVAFPAPPGVDPSLWQPDVAVLTAYHEASCILLNGAGHARWTETASLPEGRVVDTSAAFKHRLIDRRDEELQGSIPGLAPATWLDFSQAIKQAEAVKDGLMRLLPHHAELLALNHDLLHRELLEFDARMIAAGRKLAGQPFLASRPIYQYWARRYQIHVLPAWWHPQAVPGGKDIAVLEELVSRHALKGIVWEAPPSDQWAEKLHALGLASVIFEPCANVPEGQSWKAVMERNVSAMEALVGP